MTEQLQKIIHDELANLPEKVQKGINSVEWVEICNKIGLKYLLTDDGINKLQTEVLLVLINMEYLDDLKLNIENHLEILKKDAENIAEDLVKQVFNPINNKIKEDIKNNLSYKNVSWNQTINFIVSGGDYTVFLE